MQNILIRYKPRIDAALINLLSNQKESLRKVNYWGEDTIENLIPFVTAGKSIRGSLVLFSYELFGEQLSQKEIDVAAIIELIHASLLVHDDIMDQDHMRRGNKSIFAQYQEILKNKKVHDALRLGESMAICVGDLGFFIAFNLLSRIMITSKASIAITEKISHELSLVGIAQMQDIDSSIRTEKEILSLYTFKTARYTFSLPLAIGAILSNRSISTIKQLEILGEHLGILFQIVDDELNLFGDNKLTGKPVGSDLREHKQTLYYYYAKKLLPKNIWDELRSMTSGNLSADKLGKIKTLFQSHGIMDQVEKKKRELFQLTLSDINSLHLSEDKKGQIHQLSSLLLTRTK